MRDPATDAARILRGEGCQTCNWHTVEPRPNDDDFPRTVFILRCAREELLNDGPRQHPRCPPDGWCEWWKEG